MLLLTLLVFAGPGRNIAELFFFSDGERSEGTDGMNEPGTDGRDSIIGLAKEPLPVVSTAERVEMSADVSDCAFEAIVIGNGGFGSTMSKLGITLVDGCWAALGDGGLGSTTSEPGVALVNGCRS